MKKVIKKVMGITIAAALACTSLAAPQDASAAKAKKIVMNAKTVKLNVGETFKLKVKKITPVKASKKVTYKINNKAKKVIKVTKKGVIKAIAEGKANVKVTSKSNKKVKATVKVVVSEPQTVATVTPGIVATAPVNATEAPAVTEAPTATEAPAATKTPRPTRTPRPTPVPSTPTPVPTAPTDMLDHPSAPYVLPLVEENIAPSGDSSFVVNEDGTVTISVVGQYSGIYFAVPESVAENNFDTVTITYKNPVNIGPGYGCGLMRQDKNDTEDVITWAGIFAEEDEEGNVKQEGSYTATVAGWETTKAWYVTKALFFFNDAATLENGTADVTVTSVVFSHSEYEGPEVLPTEAPSAEPTEAPSAEPTEVPSDTPSTNLILNGDFSNGNENWTSNYAFTPEVGEKGYGSYTGRWNMWAAARQIITGDFKNGDKFTFSCKVRGYGKINTDEEGNETTAYDSSLYIAVKCNETEFEKFAVIEGTVTDWNTITIDDIVLPEDAESIMLSISMRDAGADFDIDDVVLTKVIE